MSSMLMIQLSKIFGTIVNYISMVALETLLFHSLNKDKNFHNYKVRGEKKIKGEWEKEKRKKERERKIDRETEGIIDA